MSSPATPSWHPGLPHPRCPAHGPPGRPWTSRRSPRPRSALVHHPPNPGAPLRTPPPPQGATLQGVAARDPGSGQTLRAGCRQDQACLTQTHVLLRGSCGPSISGWGVSPGTSSGDGTEPRFHGTGRAGPQICPSALSPARSGRLPTPSELPRPHFLRPPPPRPSLTPVLPTRNLPAPAKGSPWSRRR